MLRDPIPQLFALCAHLDRSDELNLQIFKVVKSIKDWENVPQEAELQGMAPLVNFHLRKSGATVPEDIQHSFTALSLRHMLINQVRTKTLIELRTVLSQNQIPFLVLKGAALGHLLYPSPALRPMKDMDILVKAGDCDKVTPLLINSGFKQIIEKFFHPSDLHLPTFSKEIDGFKISIEVHHRLLPDKNGQFWGYYEKFRSPNQIIPITDDVTIETINKEEFLYHLCKHTFFSYHNLEALRMIWVADICNFSERFKADIDWGFLNRNYPLVNHTLAALHELYSLSPELIEVARLSPRKNPEQAIQLYQGWPGIPMRDVKPKDKWQWIVNTIFPSGWVLFLHYGNSRFKAKWYNWLNHVSNLFSISIRHMQIRLKSKSE